MSRYWNSSRPKYVNYSRDDTKHKHNRAVANVVRLCAERGMSISQEVQFAPPSKRETMRFPFRLDLYIVDHLYKRRIAVEVDGEYHTEEMKKNRTEDLKEAFPELTEEPIHIDVDDAFLDDYVIEQLRL